MEIKEVHGWQVTSERDPAVKYLVSTTGDGAWRCDCRDYAYRGMSRYCKHVRAVRLLVEGAEANGPKKVGQFGPGLTKQIEEMFGGGKIGGEWRG